MECSRMLVSFSVSAPGKECPLRLTCFVTVDESSICLSVCQALFLYVFLSTLLFFFLSFGLLGSFSFSFSVFLLTVVVTTLHFCCPPSQPSSPIFHGCVNERLADRTPSPTFSTADSDITELADERQSEMEDFMDDEAFVDDTSSDAGTEEGSDLFSDGHDPFYDRSPWFTLVGRLVPTWACQGWRLEGGRG